MDCRAEASAVSQNYNALVSQLQEVLIGLLEHAMCLFDHNVPSAV